MNTWRIINADVREGLAQLESESVHCVVTSPPYWGLRDYGVPGQLGLEKSPEAYVERMVAVFCEVRRVLRKDGTLWLNMGDSYCASPKGSLAGQDKSGLTSTQTQEHAPTGLDKRAPGLKPKDLVGMPWRLAFALQADGWWLRCDIVWSKPNPMPESTTDRPTKSHEYLFLLAKSGSSLFWTHRDHEGTRKAPKPDYRWIDQAAAYLYDHRDDLHGKAIAATFKALGFDANLSRAGELIEHTEEPCAGWRVESFPKVPKGWPPAPSKRRWKRINLWRGHDYYYDAEAIRENSQATEASRRRAEYGRYERKDGKAKRNYRDGKPDYLQAEGNNYGGGGRNKRSVWEIATQPYPDAHFATFPEKLVEPCVKAGTSERGCCARCGAGYVRVVDVDYDNPGNRTTNGPRSLKNRQQTAGFNQRLERRAETIDWRPTCKHKKAIQPAIVLDPFCGSGAAGAMAVQLGRTFIGIELSPKYCEMARKRIGASAPLFAKETP